MNNRVARVPGLEENFLTNRNSNAMIEDLSVNSSQASQVLPMAVVVVVVGKRERNDRERRKER